MLPLLDSLRLYLECAGLLFVAWATWRGLGLFRLSRRAELRWGQGLLVLALVLPAVTSRVPRARLFTPAVQIWSGVERRNVEPYALFVPAASHEPALSGVRLERRGLVGMVLLLALGLGLSLHRLRRRVSVLSRALDGCIPFRRIGRVHLVVSPEYDVPFSAWLPRGAFVVLPLSLPPEGLTLAARHELRHHRQGDTRAVYLLEVVKALFFWQPAAWGWARDLSRAQELAVDEYLVHRRGVSARAYGGLLLAVAGQAPGSARAMAERCSPSFLRQRVESCLGPGRSRRGRLAGALAVLLLASVALAARAAIRDRGITLAEARELARDIPAGAMPIEVNDLVVARLNHYIGTPEGRRQLARGLARMPRYRPMIERALERWNVPHDFLAIPLVESAYVNTQPSTAHGAGIWQFIPPTARRYDLSVTPERDERLDPTKETQAAMRYLSDLRARFGDWRLAVKGYNEGEQAVERLMRETGTREPWRLERARSQDKYLSSVVAAIVLLHHPELLD